MRISRFVILLFVIVMLMSLLICAFKLFGKVNSNDFEDELIEDLKEFEISFELEGKTFKAMYGMTWFEWCSSAYNTSDPKIYIDGSSVYTYYNSDVGFSRVNGVKSSDIILPDVKYETTFNWFN